MQPINKNFKKAILKLLFFTFFTQLFTLLVTRNFYSTPLVEEAYEPFGQSVGGAVANSLSLILVIFIFGIFLAFLVKFKKFNFVKTIVTSFLMASVFSLTFILSSTIFPDSSILPFIFSILASLLVLLVAYFKQFSFLSKFLSFLIAAEAAGYFATILQPPTVFVFPILLASYDVYAVFAGPLKKILGKPKRVKGKIKIKLDFLPLLIVDFDLIKIGLGDVVFYSMLPAVGFVLFGIEKMILTLLATNVGVLLTILLLMKKKIPLPGLPIPMLLGVLSLILP